MRPYSTVRRHSARLALFATVSPRYDFIVERSGPDTASLLFGNDKKQRINYAKPLILMKHLVHYDFLLMLDTGARGHADMWTQMHPRPLA